MARKSSAPVDTATAVTTTPAAAPATPLAKKTLAKAAATPATPAAAKAPKTPKEPKAPREPKAAKEPKAPKAPAVKSDSPPAKRNMTAVSAEFVGRIASQLSEELAARLKQRDVKEVCEAFVRTIVDDVKAGNTVAFTNNFSFRRKLRGARTYKNLKTGDPMKKEQHFVFSMDVKPALKRAFESLPVATTGGAAPALEQVVDATVVPQELTAEAVEVAA